MYDKLARGNQVLVAGAGAAGFGTAGWLLLGPLWAIAGVVAGAFIAWIVFVVVLTLVLPDSTTVLAEGKPEEALRELRQEIAQYRRLAGMWPSQFRDVLAHRLIVQSDALHAVHQDAQARRSADEAVAIYQALAAEKPGKHGPGLADALDRQSRLLAAADRQAEALAAIETAVQLYRNLAITDSGNYLPVLAEALTCKAGWLADIDKDSEAMTTAHEAVDIYWHRLPWPEIPPDAGRAALLEGQLLCRQARYHEAAKQLARGWQVATSHQQIDALSSAMPALKATYHADADDFTTVWRAETGAAPPDWLRH
jgi:tetratricopeptide (TPR) repeat protein